MNNSNISKSFFWGMFKVEAKATTPPAGKSSGIAVQIIQQFKDRSRAEIKSWQQALDACGNPETPRWALLQDLYDNLRLDGHLTAAISLRKAATLSTKFYIKDGKTGKEIPELTALLETDWFYQVMDHALESVFCGYSVLELVDPTTMQWQLLPRRNCVPQSGFVYFEANGDKGVCYRDTAFTKNVVEIRSSHQFGLLNTIVPQLIWKRNAQQAWADLSERFGIPMVTAETTKTDKKELDKLESDLRALGQAAQAVLPQGTKITIHDQATKGDPYKIFQQQIVVTNSEVSKPIVGGTMILDDGSSRSQSEVHERTLDEKIAEADRRSIEFFVNGKLIPILRLWGYKIPDTATFVFDRTEQISLTEHWKIVSEALQFYEMDQNVIADTFNLPIVRAKNLSPTPTPTPSKNPAASLSANFQ